MHYRLAACCVVVSLASPLVSFAQTSAEPLAAGAATTPPSAPPIGGVPFPAPVVPSGTPQAKRPVNTGTGLWASLKAVPTDFARFFSSDTLKVIAIGGTGAMTAHKWDGALVEESREHLRPGPFRAGNLAGGFMVQAGASLGLYSVARLAGSSSLAAVGSDVLRAQILSQAVVHAGKFTTHRARPDGSNRYSLPSGHTASAFATAAVLQEHFGWKAGIPAYGFGAYVGASRMAANRHHLSDVLLGAAIGVASGRTVTFGVGKARLNMGVAPTDGGAAITFATH